MLTFYKYHGAGNDFIVIDDREEISDVNNAEQIKRLCHRRFGVGADGILMLREKEGYDFEMIYANSDGSMGAMCGNGGRCIVHFAHFALKIIKDPKNIRFLAADGEHRAEILESGLIKLKMHDVKEVSKRNGFPFVCQGTTPHNIVFVDDLRDYPVAETGKKIRYSDPDGVNVNFVEIKDNIFHVRTYERGVEDETMACGTGATSVAIALHSQGKLKENACRIRYPGGELTVEFEKTPEGRYKNIWLTGPAVHVFKGELE